MAIYNLNSKLSDAIMRHPSLIPVINRLGVAMGVGDNTIGRICANAHIRSDFFLSIVNTFIDEEYFPINASDTFSLDMMIDYIRKTSRYYRHMQLPNIDRHFQSLMERSGNANNLQMLRRFYDDMKVQLEWCLDNEEKLFKSLTSCREDIVKSATLVDGYREVEEKLHDLLTFFVVHLQGDYDRNLCMAVVSAIFSLEKDIRQNNRIRNRILIPLLKRSSL